MLGTQFRARHASCVWRHKSDVRQLEEATDVRDKDGRIDKMFDRKIEEFYSLARM